MGNVSRDEIVGFIEPNIRQFHKRRLENLLALRLNKILSRKNPYLIQGEEPEHRSGLGQVYP
jgi:hypothetical protein